jgi:hypothetical protein
MTAFVAAFDDCIRGCIRDDPALGAWAPRGRITAHQRPNWRCLVLRNALAATQLIARSMDTAILHKEAGLEALCR